MTTHWTMARHAHKMSRSVIREILKVTERPCIISFAAGLSSARTFPKTDSCPYKTATAKNSMTATSELLHSVAGSLGALTNQGTREEPGRLSGEGLRKIARSKPWRLRG